MKQAFHGPARFTMALAALCGASVCNSAQPRPSVAAVAADPSADEVMAKAVDAVGGKEALAKVETLRTLMNMTMQGMTIDMESCWSRAGGRLFKTKMPVGGSTMETTMGTDGKVAWRSTPAGYELLDEAQKDELEHQAGGFISLLDPAQMKAGLESIENAGKQTFADKECWRLHYKRTNGKEGDSFYDAASGMPIGFETLEKQGDTEMRSKGVFSDWKEQDGIKFFTMMTIESSMQTTPAKMKITTIEINTLDEKAFALPEEVKKLADAAAAGGGAAASKAKDIALADLTPEQQETAKQALEGMRQIEDPAQRKAMIQRMESVIPMMPANEQLPMKYAIQELKKDMAKAGG